LDEARQASKDFTISVATARSVTAGADSSLLFREMASCVKPKNQDKEREERERKKREKKKVASQTR